VIKDFEGESKENEEKKQTEESDNKNDSKNIKPQYGAVHLCFTSPVSEELVQMLASCK
jgi:hypothetical protein